MLSKGMEKYTGESMLSELEQLAQDMTALRNSLILLTGVRGSGKTHLLRSFAQRRRLVVLNLGSELGKRLLDLPSSLRSRRAGTEFRALMQAYVSNEFLLLDNLEVLFDSTLALNPLDLLRQSARVRPVIAVWPGELRGTRLIYADTGHPEHRSYPAMG